MAEASTSVKRWLEDLQVTREKQIAREQRKQAAEALGRLEELFLVARSLLADVPAARQPAGDLDPPTPLPKDRELRLPSNSKATFRTGKARMGMMEKIAADFDFEDLECVEGEEDEKLR